MNILLFAGTTEGRLLAARLAALPARLTVCTATEYGADLLAGRAELSAVGVAIRAGRLDADAMLALMREEHTDLVIDATHPYASAATKAVREAARAAGAKLLRLSRAAGGTEDCGKTAEHFPDAAAAARALAGTEGNVLLATGAKSLPAFASVPGFAERMFPRVLPAEESLRACAALGFPRSHVIAMQGPFTRELNRAMLRMFSIRILVTKDGGAPGGFAEKLLAAEDEGVRVFVIDRPRGQEDDAKNSGENTQAGEETNLTVEEILAAVTERLNTDRPASPMPQSTAAAAKSGAALTLIGAGPGTERTLTREALDALRKADAIIGAPRLLAGLAGTLRENAGRAETLSEALPENIPALLAAHPRWRAVAVLLSGDPGFHSGAKKLLALFPDAAEGDSPSAAAPRVAAVLPGISTPQYFAAKLRRPWQNLRLVSAHAAACDVLAEVLNHPAVLFLAGGQRTPGTIAAALADAGLGGATVTVGENLSAPDERITAGSAADFADKTFAPLSVVLVENAQTFTRASAAAGIPDDEFLRGDVPMTKREVRAMVLSLLAPRPGDTLYDVGAGTGSVSVELALAARRGRVYAVDGSDAALTLIAKNRTKFGAYNILPVRGRAPAALADLPPPDAAFIGGSGGMLPATAECVLRKNPRARLVAAAATLETLAAATASFRDLGLRNTEVTQIAATRALARGNVHLLTPQTPVFLIAGGGETKGASA